MRLGERPLRRFVADRSAPAHQAAEGWRFASRPAQGGNCKG
jgi:hypothetical protein